MAVSEIDIPPTALLEADADEFLRVWIAGGDAHVTLRMGVFGECELESWGMILADAARHVVAAYQDKHEIEAVKAYDLIEEGYRGRLAEKVTSTTNSLRAKN